MSNNKSYEYEVAVIDQLLKEKKISYQEWYELLMLLRKKYGLLVINVVDNNSN